MKLAMTVALAGALLAADGAARADGAQDERARQLFQVGRDAYHAGDFQKAYDAFIESFTLSHQPALLYNVASALEGLHRSHDAAETLRGYLRLRPDDPDRPQIEERIRTLEEEQRLLDLEKHNGDQPPTPTPPPGAALATSPSPSLTANAPPASAERTRMRKRTALIVGLTAGAVVVAGVAIGLAFGLSPHEAPLTPSPVGPINATR